MQTNRWLTNVASSGAWKSRRLAGLAICSSLLLAFALASPAQATLFSATNLVTDDQNANAAQITDAGLKNAWGISYSPTSPFWVSANGTGTAQIFSVNPLTQTTSQLGLVVTIPGAGSVTGQSFNTTGAGAFNGDSFLFVSEDGTISGWRGALGTNAEVLQTALSTNVYKGAAQATINGHGYLYTANFYAGTIDVLKGDGAAPSLSGNFTDPNLPSGFAPFNIQNINGKLYVTYAKQDGNKTDDVAGAGNGFVSVFDLQGNFLGRVASQGTLNSPWGLAIAPASFGSLAGDLLVGNFGDGTISAFDLLTDSFVGQLLGTGGTPLMIDGLWGLMAGNGGSGGSTQSIYFSAGPGGEAHGLFGVISATPEPGTLALLGLGLAGLAVTRRRKQ